jgi:flagellar basal body rod protein FlgG
VEKAKVYLIREITAENLVKLYDALNIKLEGNVAVKLHSGEAGNQNYLRPEFVKNIIEHVNGTVVECNTAYNGARNTTEKHMKLIEDHDYIKQHGIERSNLDVISEVYMVSRINASIIATTSLMKAVDQMYQEAISITD